MKLTEVKFKLLLERNYDFKKETVHFLSYLVKNNRPIRELYDADYQIVNKRLAVYYGKEDVKNIDPNKYVKVVNPKTRGGLLSQSSFFIAKSDGVDPLPFRRAEWIMENVFGKEMYNFILI